MTAPVLDLRSNGRATAAAVRSDERTEVERRAARLAHVRWPRQDTAELARRVMRRYALQIAAGDRPADLSGWLRRTMFDVVRGDRHADAGQRHYETELGVLLGQLTASPARRVRPDLVKRAVAHLHPRDRLLLRLRLLGHESGEVATSLGTTPAAVDQAYRRSRHRLRAVIEHDRELLAHLRELSRPARWSRVRPPGGGPYDLAR